MDNIDMNVSEEIERIFTFRLPLNSEEIDMNDSEETTRIFTFRLPLNSEELDRLFMCCNYTGTVPSEFLRMLINKFGNEIEVQSSKMIL